jgi:hypothetical protein
MHHVYGVDLYYRSLLAYRRLPVGETCKIRSEKRLMRSTNRLVSVVFGAMLLLPQAGSLHRSCEDKIEF